MSEDVHPRADELDTLNALELVRLMNAEDASAVRAIEPELGLVARAVEEIAGRLGAGGRLHYFGAGTSGLIARMDAAECPATFGVAADLVQAHAGEAPADEDDADLGGTAVRRAGTRAGDVAVGISASGRTAYVLGALHQAAQIGALRVAITCNPGSPLGRAADIAIEIATGPEVIAGSTRLKAGTVQKLVLNMLSTAVFTRLGRTHRGRMVGLVAANDKLRERAARIVADLAGLSPEDARRRLDEAGGDIRAALEAVRPS
ncbi:MAG TPA: N-acetylmuramic acid 6-phosphate etherase [Candidatus Dormibacteraeota bacterium]|nr:N-acetylmuramic acid 6-phosphate etherase [Candidatus Dormibacteraeota bacterium]